jgi:hypothetical protein
MSLAIFPKIKGTTIRKENLAALFLSIPNKTEVEIVAPDLEIPGSIATACAKPYNNCIWENFTPLPVFLALSAKNNSTAVTNNMISHEYNFTSK